MAKVPNYSCPNCAASLSFSADNCPYCNTHVATPARIEQRKKAAALFVTAVNEELMQNGWRVDAVMMLALMLPVVVVMVARRWEQSWLLAIVFGVVVFFFLLVMVDSVTTRVRSRRFDAEIKPQLQGFVEKTNWTLSDLLATISDELPEDAELRKFVGRL